MAFLFPADIIGEQDIMTATARAPELQISDTTDCHMQRQRNLSRAMAFTFTPFWSRPVSSDSGAGDHKNLTRMRSTSCGRYEVSDPGRALTAFLTANKEDL